MDFDFNHVSEENKESKKQNNKTVSLIISIVIALVVGISVFLVCNALFGKKELPEEPVFLKSTKLSLTEDNVTILYRYVTYGTFNVRGDKFLKGNVTLDSFSNQEKFYYALQFLQSDDFVNTNKTNSKGLTIYHISGSTIDNYMKRFFGSDVTYSKNSVITYPFDFKLAGQNIGIFTYLESDDVYEVVFDGVEEKEYIIDPYYGELVEAYKEPDGSYKLIEKVVFTKVEKQENTYTVSIYGDYNHTVLLDTKTGLNEESVKKAVDVSTYLDKAQTVTYLFGLDGTMLHFSSSSIQNS